MAELRTEELGTAAEAKAAEPKAAKAKPAVGGAEASAGVRTAERKAAQWEGTRRNLFGKTSGNRQHKDRLFRMIFQEKKDLLSLYNAVNGSHYTDPSALEITTIEDVLYMGYKNDVSFLIDDYLNLYEAQSSWNPNMPLRGLFYFSSLYSGYIETRRLDLYSRSRILIPTPRFVVFTMKVRRQLGGINSGMPNAPARLSFCSDAFADRRMMV